ncbi:MAG TPA: DUF1499 domain-containing protein [Thiotrichales bacterium]|nr:DUF1499 domain-containing protein [Thiotrichales bacterium]
MKILLIIILLAVGLVFATLIKNDAPLLQPPGLKTRLSVYLGRNVAETADNHPFRELKTPVFNRPADVVYKQVVDAVAALGWKVVYSDPDNQIINATIQTPLLLFTDDMMVQVKYIDPQHSSLHIRSASRIGKADFAANEGHILALLKALSEQEE